MSTDKNGATVNPHATAAAVADCPRMNGQRGAHKFVWMWQASTMTDKVKCVTCGEVRRRTTDGDEILVKGVTHDPV